jgi:TatD DNase family protein
MFSEAHGHLGGDIDSAVTRAENAGVELILVAGIDLASSEKAVNLAARFEPVKACVGIHPWNADEYSERAKGRLLELTSKDGVVAISEIGLDAVGRRDRTGEYVNKPLPMDVQLEAFLGQLDLAKEVDLPVIVHDRMPSVEVLNYLEERDVGGLGAAIHGFDKDETYAERFTAMGAYLSISARSILIQENEGLRKAIMSTPIEWLLTETDRGEPADVVESAREVAKLKGLMVEETGRKATENLRRLLRL